MSKQETQEKPSFDPLSELILLSGLIASLEATIKNMGNDDPQGKELFDLLIATKTEKAILEDTTGIKVTL
jgi:hypothetical protein